MDDLLKLAEENLFGAVKRIARTMGCDFVLNERGKQRVAEEAAALRSRHTVRGE